MPRPPETPDIRASKTLAYILRHGAEKEQLSIRSDGYLKLNDVLARPKMKDVNLEMVLRLVEENAKQRFELFYGYDPSPPRPKKGKGKGRVAPSSKSKAVSKVTLGDGPDVSAARDSSSEQGQDKEINLEDKMASTSIAAHVNPPSTELPLVPLSPPPSAESSITSEQTEMRGQMDGLETEAKGEYFIRARQGHSIHLESTDHLTPVLDDEEGRKRVGDLVHGTKWELWDVIKREGLSKMARQHIHLAPGLIGTITPRPTSTLYIYLSLTALLTPEPPLKPIDLYTSSNGVILSPGDPDGKITSERWDKVIRVERCGLTGSIKGNGNKSWVVWEGGKEVERLIEGPARFNDGTNNEVEDEVAKVSHGVDDDDDDVGES